MIGTRTIAFRGADSGACALSLCGNRCHVAAQLGERVGELAPAASRFTLRDGSDGMPNSNDTVGRRCAKPGCEPHHPIIEERSPLGVFEGLGKERSPIDEPVTTPSAARQSSV